MSKVIRTLAALNIIFFFSFGVLSVSFAGNELFSPGLHRHLKSHGSPKGQLAQGDRKTLKRGAPIEEDSEQTSPSHDLLEVKKSAEVVLRNSQSHSTSRSIFAPKVSTNILQS